MLHDQHNLFCNGTMLIKGGQARPAARAVRPELVAAPTLPLRAVLALALM